MGYVVLDFSLRYWRRRYERYWFWLRCCCDVDIAALSALYAGGCSFLFMWAFHGIIDLYIKSQAYKLSNTCTLCFLWPIAAYFSVMFSMSVRGAVMIKALGLLLIAVAAYYTFLGEKIKISPTFINGSIAGFLGGTGAGLFAVGGPPIAIYLLACTDDNDVYRATICTHFCCTSVMASLTRFQQGIITSDTLQLWFLMLIGIALGIFLGNKIFHKLSARRLRLVVCFYLALSGLIMLFK